MIELFRIDAGKVFRYEYIAIKDQYSTSKLTCSELKVPSPLIPITYTIVEAIIKAIHLPHAPVAVMRESASA